MSHQKWVEWLFWLALVINAVGAIAGFASGEFWRPLTALGVAATAGIIILDEREIRRLRARPPIRDVEYFVIRPPS